MAAPPSTPQKLLAEALGTAFLVYVGAGSAAAHRPGKGAGPEGPAAPCAVRRHLFAPKAGSFPLTRGRCRI